MQQSSNKATRYKSLNFNGSIEPRTPRTLDVKNVIHGEYLWLDLQYYAWLRKAIAELLGYYPDWGQCKILAAWLTNDAVRGVYMVRLDDDRHVMVTSYWDQDTADTAELL